MDMPGIFRILLLSLISLSTAVATADKLALSHRRHLANGNVQDKAVAKPYLISARPNGHTRPRTLSNAAEIASGTQDIYDRLVAAPARNAGRIEKAAVLPLAKYDVEHFDRNPFREW